MSTHQRLFAPGDRVHLSYTPGIQWTIVAVDLCGMCGDEIWHMESDSGAHVAFHHGTVADAASVVAEHVAISPATASETRN